MQITEHRTMWLLAATAVAVYLLMAAAVELTRTEARAEVATARADLAAWEVSRLMEEARNITRVAALGGGEHAAG